MKTLLLLKGLRAQFLFAASLLSVLLFPNESLAQSGIRLGYSGALIRPAEINRVFYIYNQKGGFDKEMSYMWGVHGFSLAYLHAIDNDIFYELRFQNRHCISSAERTFTGIVYRREVKLQQNFISGGFYFGQPFYVGIDMDLGNWRGFSRVNTIDSISKTEWTRVFTLADQYETRFQKGMQVGATIYCGLEADFFGIRLYYQYQFLRKSLDALDDELLGFDIEEDNYLTDKGNNLGIELYLKIGGK